MSDAEKPKMAIGDIRKAKAKLEADIMRMLDKFCFDYKVRQKDLTFLVTATNMGCDERITIKISLEI